MEVDELDKESLHVFKMLDGKVAAYCRLYPKGEQMALGRVLVSQEYRKHKLERELVQTALDVVVERFPDKSVYAQAQAYLENFYASLASHEPQMSIWRMISRMCRYGEGSLKNFISVFTVAFVI